MKRKCGRCGRYLRFSGSLRKAAVVTAAALTLLFAAVPLTARADAIVESFWSTMYDVDYYVVVDAPDGGVNMRWGAGAQYGKVREELIPNGEVLHIVREARADNGKYWGDTEYEEDYGWVILGQTRKIETPPETTAGYEEPPAVYAETTAAPTGTTAALGDTAPAAAETTAAPVETTAAPAETTTAPAETTAAPAEKAEKEQAGFVGRLLSFLHSLF